MLQQICRFILAAGICMSSVLATNTRDVLELVAAYNSRSLGQHGMRRVAAELRTKGVITRTYIIENGWMRKENSVRTFFYLDSPSGLRGTRYLQLETPGAQPELAVYLHLPT